MYGAFEKATHKVSYTIDIFNFILGSVLNGVKCTGNGQLVFYPLGSSVVVRHLSEGGRRQSFLTGHSYPISCIEVGGDILVTGEEHQIGTKVRFSL